MKANGDLICKREPVWIDETRREFEPPDDFKVTCEWQGGRVALISQAMLRELDYGNCAPYSWKISENLYQIAQYRVRIIGLCVESGAYMDCYYMMQEGRLARFLAWYHKHSRGLIFWLCQSEARVRRFFGQDVEGKFMPFTGFVGDLILILK